MPTIISKSKYLSGIQCDKLLWTYYNQKQLIPPTDPNTQWIFDQGHEVGKLAQQLVPGGIEVPFGTMEETVTATQQLLPLRKPIFEASFLADGVYCRVDILQPAEGDAWDVLEVKSSNSAKGVNVFDLVVQRHALLASGLRIRRLYLVHLNAEYVRRGEIVVSELFQASDLTRDVERLAASVPPELARQRAVIAAEDPRTPIGRQCDTPYTCPLKPHCWAFLPADSVTTLHRAGQNAFRLLRDGILHAVDVPEAGLSAHQQIQQRALREGRAQVDVTRLRKWLDALEYPCLFLDFEAFASAIPRHDGTSPHQHVPFQVSVHRLDAPGAEPSHLEFLAEQPADPRPRLAAFLASLPSAGSVVAYHKSYEAGILARLAAALPEHREALNSLSRRLVDLEDPFRHFDYYHPHQHGRTSLKAVLPALTGLSYEGDEIGDGSTASREYMRVVYGGVEESEKQRVLEQLRQYCQKDTWAMVAILRVLEAECES